MPHIQYGQFDTDYTMPELLIFLLGQEPGWWRDSSLPSRHRGDRDTDTPARPGRTVRGVPSFTKLQFCLFQEEFSLVLSILVDISHPPSHQLCTCGRRTVIGRPLPSHIPPANVSSSSSTRPPIETWYLATPYMVLDKGGQKE